MNLILERALSQQRILTMRRVRNRMEKPAPLGDVLREALKASNIKVDLELLKLWEQWADLVGPGF